MCVRSPMFHSYMKCTIPQGCSLLLLRYVFDTLKQYNEKTTEQFNSGRSRIIFGINVHKYSIGRTIVGKHAWQQEEEQKGDISTCTDISGTIVDLRALQGHSGRNLIDLSLQDNVIIQSGFFQHIYHIGCAFNLHSIINNGLIPGGQNSSKRQTVFFLPIDPRDKGHQDPAKIDFIVPRRAQYLHTVLGRNIKTRCFGLTLILRFEKD